MNKEDYMIENVKGETVGKMPGSLNGIQFIIQNCEVQGYFDENCLFKVKSIILY